jgi:hypothetical protein
MKSSCVHESAFFAFLELTKLIYLIRYISYRIFLRGSYLIIPRESENIPYRTYRIIKRPRRWDSKNSYPRGGAGSLAGGSTSPAAAPSPPRRPVTTAVSHHNLLKLRPRSAYLIGPEAINVRRKLHLRHSPVHASLVQDLLQIIHRGADLLCSKTRSCTVRMYCTSWDDPLQVKLFRARRTDMKISIVDAVKLRGIHSCENPCLFYC